MTRRAARRQLGARIPQELIDALKRKSGKTGKSYPAILADAYELFADVVETNPNGHHHNGFDYQPPVRVNNGRLVQFYLTEAQIGLLKKLASKADNSVAGTIRDLLKRHLMSENSGQNGAATPRVAELVGASR